jgi:hypothetical protein
MKKTNKLMFLLCILFLSCQSFSWTDMNSINLMISPVGWKNIEEIEIAMNQFWRAINYDEVQDTYTPAAGYTFKNFPGDKIEIHTSEGELLFWIPFSDLIQANTSNNNEILSFSLENRSEFLVIPPSINSDQIHIDNNGSETRFRYVGAIASQNIYMPFEGSIERVLPEYESENIQDSELDDYSDVVLSKDTILFIFIDIYLNEEVGRVYHQGNIIGNLNRRRFLNRQAFSMQYLSSGSIDDLLFLVPIYINQNS